MKRRVTIYRLGVHAAWIRVEGGPPKLVVVPKEVVAMGQDPYFLQPGDGAEIELPDWVEEAAEVL